MEVKLSLLSAFDHVFGSFRVFAVCFSLCRVSGDRYMLQARRRKHCVSLSLSLSLSLTHTQHRHRHTRSTIVISRSLRNDISSALEIVIRFYIVISPSPNVKWKVVYIIMFTSSYSVVFEKLMSWGPAFLVWDLILCILSSQLQFY